MSKTTSLFIVYLLFDNCPNTRICHSLIFALRLPPHLYPAALHDHLEKRLGRELLLSVRGDNLYCKHIFLLLSGFYPVLANFADIALEPFVLFLCSVLHFCNYSRKFANSGNLT